MLKKIFTLLKVRKNFITYSLMKILIMTLGLVTNILIIRKLSIDDYGIFSIIFMFIGLITTFGFSWSSSSILYFGSKEKVIYGNINKTFWSRNIIIFFSLIIVTILFASFSNKINDYIGIKVSFLILIWLYVSVAEDYLSMYFLAVKKQLISSMLSVTAKVIYIILVLIVPFDVKTLIVLNIISHSTVALYIFGINRSDIGKFEFDKLWFKEVLNFSLWQLFGFSGLYLINFGDIAVIKHFMTTQDVGIYNAAYNLFNAVAGFAFVISSYYAPSVSRYFVNKENKKVKYFFYKERFLILGVVAIAHLLIILLSKPIFMILYGQRYLPAVKIFNILMLGSICNYGSVFYMLFYNINKKHKVLQLINIFQAIINVILSIVFINLFGIIGPSIASVIAIMLSTLFSFFYCENRIRYLDS